MNSRGTGPRDFQSRAIPGYATSAVVVRRASLSSPFRLKTLAEEGQNGHSTSSSEERTFMAIAVKPSAEIAIVMPNPDNPGLSGKSFSAWYNSSISTTNVSTLDALYAA